MRLKTTARTVALVGAVALGLAACGGGGGSAPSGGAAPAPPSAAAFAGPVGAGEGQLSVLAWPGYAEDGSTDPAVDWVTPFEQQTGWCPHRATPRCGSCTATASSR